MAENLKTLDINQFPKATEIKDDDTLLLIRPSANGKVKPMRIDGNLVPKASDLATKANVSDVLLAEDTAALVADAKRAAFEGEKTTLLAPTYYSNYDDPFSKNINLNEGELHIKIQFDPIHLSQYSGLTFMNLGIISVGISRESDNPKIQIGSYKTYTLNDQQLEFIVYKDGHVDYISGDYQANIGNVDQQFTLEGFYAEANKISYTCEVFQYNFVTMKMSRLDNDCGYVTSKDGNITASEITISGVQYNKPHKVITCINENGNYATGITATSDQLRLPNNTYIEIVHAGNGTEYKCITSVINDYSNSVYKIVDELPNIGDNSRNIYMVKKADSTDSNVKYDKYIYIKEDEAWEKIG